MPTDISRLTLTAGAGSWTVPVWTWMSPCPVTPEMPVFRGGPTLGKAALRKTLRAFDTLPLS